MLLGKFSLLWMSKYYKIIQQSDHTGGEVHVKALAPKRHHGWNVFNQEASKHFTLINYDSRVVPDWKIPHITTLEL